MALASDGAEDMITENAPLVPQPEAKRACSSDCAKAVAEKVWRWTLTNLLLVLTVIAVVIGVVLGVAVREAGPGRVAIELISFPGELLLRMLRLLILPLIIFSLVTGLGSLGTKAAGSLGWKTVLYYFTTTVLAVCLGLVLVVTIRPGERHSFKKCDNSTVVHSQLDVLDSILDLLRNVFPDNIFAATFQQTSTVYRNETITDWMKCAHLYYDNITQECEMKFPGNNLTCCSCAEKLVDMNGSLCANETVTNRVALLMPREGMNVLGIIVFTVAFTVVLARMGSEGRRVIQLVSVLNEVIMKLVMIVMWYSPVGIASIIAGKLLEVESFAVLFQQIGYYFLTVMVGLTIHSLVILPLLYLVLTRSNPLKIVRAITQALLFAFGTSSSSATLPVTMKCLEDNFGADKRVTQFMLPVGSTINMDGTALYEAVAAVFIAQVEGVGTSFANIIVISITATAASIGAAGVPQAGLITLVIVLVAVGLPPEDAAIIITVDWLLDRFRTVVNVLGDSFGVGIVQHYSRKQLEEADASRDFTDDGDTTSLNMARIETQHSPSHSPPSHSPQSRSPQPNGHKLTSSLPVSSIESPIMSMSQSVESGERAQVFISDTALPSPDSLRRFSPVVPTPVEEEDEEDEEEEEEESSAL